MKVKELIEQLKKLDQDKSIWVLYDPPYFCREPVIDCLEDAYKDYADMFDETEEKDYAIICGGNKKGVSQNFPFL
jgi:hypothetical protein